MPFDHHAGRRTALPGVLLLVAALGALVWLAGARDGAAGRPRVAATAPSTAAPGAATPVAAAPSAGPDAVPRAATSARDPAARSGGPDAAPRGIRPASVRIPAIGVDAAVIALGLNPDGTLEVPTDFDVAGWWTGGTRPGAAGPAVVVGHVDSRAGPGVFLRLRELRPGDRVELRDRAGRAVRFAVERSEQHPKDAFPTAAVYGDTPAPTLRLITCGGAFDRAARSYTDNVIVYASLAGVVSR